VEAYSPRQPGSIAGGARGYGEAALASCGVADEGISVAALGNRPGHGPPVRRCRRGIRVIGVHDGYDSERRGHNLEACEGLC
jgi:hypothetical protein